MGGKGVCVCVLYILYIIYNIIGYINNNILVILIITCLLFHS